MDTLTTAAYFEHIVEGYTLTFGPLRDSVVEDMHFPPMRTILRELGRTRGKPPTQEQFTEACMLRLGPQLANPMHEGARARLARAYASLVREQHFGLALRDACHDHPVIVSESDQLDLAQGIDFGVIGAAGNVGICVRQSTRRAVAFDSRKAWRRAEGWHVLTAELGNDNRIIRGSFWLFDPVWVQRWAESEVIPLAVDGA